MANHLPFLSAVASSELQVARENQLQAKTSCKCQVVSCIRTAVRLKAMNLLIAGRAVLSQPSSVLRFFKRFGEFPEHSINAFGLLLD